MSRHGSHKRRTRVSKNGVTSRNRTAGALASHHATNIVCNRNTMIAHRCLKSANARAKRLKTNGRQAKLICKREKDSTTFHIPQEILSECSNSAPNGLKLTQEGDINGDPKTAAATAGIAKSNLRVETGTRADVVTKGKQVKKKTSTALPRSSMRKLQQDVTKKRKLIQ